MVGVANSDGSLPFPLEMYAANADYPGSCGRCYQVGLLALA
jgi:cullin-associated NEDD8-dissociated protein 1